LAITGGFITDVNDNGEVVFQSSASHGPAVSVGDPLLRVTSSTSVWLLFLIVVPVVGAEGYCMVGVGHWVLVGCLVTVVLM
jgi:hypothetical protein